MNEADKYIIKSLMHIPRLHKSRIHSRVLVSRCSPLHIPVLGFINGNGSPTQKEIAEAFNVSPPTITVMLKRLEKNSLISRTPDSGDGRVIRVTLTAEGKELFRMLESELIAAQSGLLDGLSEDEKSNLAKYLQRITKNLGGSCIEEDF